MTSVAARTPEEATLGGSGQATEPDEEALAKLWQRGKLDARCEDCGEGMAATDRCFKCGSKNLRYIPHGSADWTHCLAGGGGAIGVKRDTSAARAAKAMERKP